MYRRKFPVEERVDVSENAFWKISEEEQRWCRRHHLVPNAVRTIVAMIDLAVGVFERFRPVVVGYVPNDFAEIQSLTHLSEAHTDFVAGEVVSMPASRPGSSTFGQMPAGRRRLPSETLCLLRTHGHGPRRHEGLDTGHVVSEARRNFRFFFRHGQWQTGLRLLPARSLQPWRLLSVPAFVRRRTSAVQIR